MNTNPLPRPLAPVDHDRAAGRLMHDVGETYRSPLPCFGFIHGRSVHLIEPLLESEAWALVCAADPHQLNSFRPDHSCDTVGLLAEVLSRGRFHVLWIAGVFTFTGTKNSSRSLRAFVLDHVKRAPGSTALVKAGDGGVLVSPNGQVTRVGNTVTIGDTEAALSRIRPDGRTMELVGSAFPANQVGAMSYRAAGWTWLAGSPLVVPRRIIGQHGEGE